MEMVNILVQSSEFEARNLDEVGFVSAFYLGALGREADEDGLWYNVNLLWNGMSRIDLINGIMDVPGGEFDNVCNSLGIVMGYGHVTGAAPVINDGDFIAVREVSNLSQIYWGQIYLVQLDDFRVVKYLRRHTDPNMVVLRSENPNYDDMDVRRSDIHELLLVQHILHINSRL